MEWHTQGSEGAVGMVYGAVCLTLFAMCRQVPFVQCCWRVAASVGAVDVHGLCSWGSLLGFSEQLSTAKFSKQEEQLSKVLWRRRHQEGDQGHS